MKRLSIIVPVYNVAPYLSRCLNSLQAQGLAPEDHEIIIINDGSTDNSGSIAAEFAGNNPGIRLINQPNQGLGGARNTGILHAKGTYIQFVDPDDFLEPGVLRSLLDKMDRENLDVLRFNYQHVNDQAEVIVPYKDSKKFVDYADNITDGMTFLTERLGYACYATQFIFRSSLIQRQENYFKTGTYFEDTEWTPRILVQAVRVTSVSTIVYNYFLHQGSITQSTSDDDKRKLKADKFHVIEALQRQMRDAKDQRWYRGMIARIAVTVLGETATGEYNEYTSVVSDLKVRNIFPLYAYRMTQRQKVHLFLVNLSPAFYGFLKHTIRL